jgi:toxin-antitoxin system PIN domain toxin
MTCIADPNVLFPLLVRGHVAHATAFRWWEKQPNGNVGLCLLTRLAVMRLLTNRAAMNGAPISPGDTLAVWHALADDPRSLYVDTVPPSHEGCFVPLVQGRQPTPNLWTDAWLAALAQSLDYELTTFDRGFTSFEGLRLHLLWVEVG